MLPAAHCGTSGLTAKRESDFPTRLPGRVSDFTSSVTRIPQLLRVASGILFSFQEAALRYERIHARREKQGSRPISSRLARFSHHLTAEARHNPAITALRLLAVLNVGFKHARIIQEMRRRAARALY